MAVMMHPKYQMYNSVLGLRSQPLVTTSTATIPVTIPTRKGTRLTPSGPRCVSSKATSRLNFIPGAGLPKLGQQHLTSTRSISSDPASTTSSTSASESPPANIPLQPSATKLNWNEYLSLRRKRRRYNLVSSICTSTGTAVAGLTALNQNFESIGSLVGLDPMFTMAFGTIGSVGVGWLSGPIFGSAVFNMMYSGVRKDMEEVGTLT